MQKQIDKNILKTFHAQLKQEYCTKKRKAMKINS
jgi:hypothetical protein